MSHTPRMNWRSEHLSIMGASFPVMVSFALSLVCPQSHSVQRLTSLLEEGMFVMPVCKEVSSSAETLERWLDDGGTSDNEAAYDMGGFSPLQISRP